MGQGEIQKLLEKLDLDEWVSTEYIEEILNWSNGRVNRSVRKLRSYRELETKCILVGNYRRSFHRLTPRGRGQ